MEILIIILAFILLSLIPIVLFVPDHRRRLKARRHLNSVLKQCDFEYVVFDIRDGKSYENSHIPGAVNFPLSKMDYLPIEDMFLHIFLYGENKEESHRAFSFLSETGYFNVHDLGSFKFWKGEKEQGPGLAVDEYSRQLASRKKNEKL